MNHILYSNLGNHLKKIHCQDRFQLVIASRFPTERRRTMKFLNFYYYLRLTVCVYFYGSVYIEVIPNPPLPNIYSDFWNLIMLSIISQVLNSLQIYFHITVILETISRLCYHSQTKHMVGMQRLLEKENIHL